ncbi:MAG: sulfatase-like hydrolase/transferase [Planctomycetes bacterium]|nr:sulfatase-like hydrolase/transferase [Planctomycetota bacterium]
MATERPNVIFVLTDDQGPWAAGCCGNPEIRTPNIDRLANQGVQFENFFCSSPVCSPARASLMTGRIPSAHGVHDWIRERNMPPDPVRYIEDCTCYTDVLAENDYTVGLSGKWHLGDSLTPQHGFSYWYCMPQGGSRYQDAEMIWEGEVQEFPGYLTDRITDYGIQFIEQTWEDGPFYLSLNYNAPHSPWTGHPEELTEQYDDCPFKSCPQEAMHPWARGLAYGNLGNRESLKGYFGAVTGLDIGVGRVLDKLEELGIRDNTLVVFSADNGFSCGHHGFWGKGNGTYPMNMYENSVKVPFVVSHPNHIPEGEVAGAMMSQYDFMPTLLDYLNLPAVEGDKLPGESYAPVWEGERDGVRDEVVVYDEYGPVRMIRTRDWKYIHRYPYGPHELYDLVNDPDERNNLVEEPEQNDRVEEMRGRLDKWFRCYVDPALDGTHCGVSGKGQKNKIGLDCAPESAFYQVEE